MTLQSLAQIVNDFSASGLPSLPEARKPVAITERDAEIVNEAFARLQVIFPAWQRAFPTPESLQAAKSEWIKALVEADCVSDTQLVQGFRTARGQDIPWFPSPGQFIKWCQTSPEALGLPSVDEALVDVCRHRPSHPAVVLAARATKWERQTLTAEEYRPVFEQAYEQLLHRVMAGEDLSLEIRKALPTREQIKHSPEYYQETGMRGIEMLRGVFKRSNTYISDNKIKNS
jgi:hypothetical protein